MHERYLTDADGNQIAVVLDLDTYRQMLADLEDLEDIRAADAAKMDDPHGLPLNEARAEIDRERAETRKVS